MTSRHAHGLTTSHEFSISKGCSPWDALTKVSETQGREDPDPDAVIEKIATDGRRSAREKSVPSPQGRSLRKVCKGGSEEFVKCSVEILFDPISPTSAQLFNKHAWHTTYGSHNYKRDRTPSCHDVNSGGPVPVCLACCLLQNKTQALCLLHVAAFKPNQVEVNRTRRPTTTSHEAWEKTVGLVKRPLDIEFNLKSWLRKTSWTQSERLFVKAAGWSIHSACPQFRNSTNVACGITLAIARTSCGAARSKSPTISNVGAEIVRRASSRSQLQSTPVQDIPPFVHKR